MKSFYVRNSAWFDVFFLAVIFWASRYFFSSRFGLYEDDLTRIPSAFSMNLSEIWNHWCFLMTRYFANRPLHEGFIYTLSWLGWQINGLQGAYWIGYSITVVNIGLFYFLLRRLHSRYLGLLGGLAYALFSADTTQAYLTMSLGGQLSNTLLLAAFHVYLFGPKWISYVLVYPIILFAYETPFLVFMAAPVLDVTRNRKSIWRDLFIHTCILFVMLLSSFVMRYAQGGGISFEMSYRETVEIALKHIIQGPLVAMGTYLLRPYQALKMLNPDVGIVSSASFLVLVAYLWIVKSPDSLDPRQILDAVRLRRISVLNVQMRNLLQLSLAGLIMLLLAYPMTFTTRLTAISGRTTRGHLAGVSGASMLLAVFSYVIVALFAHYRREKVAIALLSGWFALLVGFGIVVQLDYVRAWQNQKDFWTELLPLIPDADSGTAILVQPEGLEDVLQIGANTWNLSRVLDQLYNFPLETSLVPRVYRLLPDWKNKIALDDTHFQINGETVTAPPDNYNLIQSDKVILISTTGGSMKRVDGPFEINGTLYPLKPQTGPVMSNLPRGVLYSLLVHSLP